MTEGARRGRREEPLWAQTIGRRGPWPGRATLCSGGPTASFASFSSCTPSSQNLSHREDLTKGYSRLCGAENTREKRALRRAGIRRGNSLPEGEIDAIAIVIERDIISIIIIIISTIYTAITTAAPRHRCSNSVNPSSKLLVNTFCSSLGSTLLFIESTTIHPLYLWVITPIHEFLRGLLFVYGLQLHHFTPNSILHISIFITLCECFLGVQPSWALWKRIFFIRRNGSHNITYNIGGVVICIRPDVEYFDVKFPDSVQGWRKRWLYVREDCPDSLEYNIAPFDGSAKILRRRSWDAEATEEEKTATEALMSRIHELQNTRGQELSGIQITAHFLRIRVQPLQARKNPLWIYASDKDVDRMSTDLSVKDLEKLVQKISSLNKKDPVPSSCRVVPYSGTNALPQNHQTSSSLPPLPEGGEVDEQAIVADDTQVPSQPESEAVVSQKSTARSEKEVESEASESTESIPSAVSPKNKWKRGDVEDSGASKPSSAPVEETAPEGPQPFDAYASALISSDEEEEEETAANATAPMSTSHTLAVSETPRTAEETSTPHPDPQRSTPATSPRASSPKRARIELGEQFFLAGVSPTPSLDDADDLATELKASEESREKAEKDASCVEDLRKRLHEAETALSEKITQNIAHEGKIAARLESLNRLFVRKMRQDFVLEKPEDNRLLDALSLLEIHVDLVRRSIFDARTAFSRLFPYFFH
ncbi:hypothetical protein QYE76_029360 [Lolium multiflorum]|uniref:Transposase (putative) gypsy type domain-containing protein n=1 Tax=Lolium multiflorum TaxID=4521 RepID=A0AAD8VFF2_LOLMU|nr:hypothetical protein QYE76_029360 [Lolium multiflorum]